MIFDGHVYRDRTWRLATLESPDHHLYGYLAATNGLGTPTNDVYVYEAVGADDASTAGLITHARESSPAAKVTFPYVSLENPVVGVLRNMGFEEKESTPHLMVRMLRPDLAYKKLAGDSDVVRSLELTCATPHRTVAVAAPEHPRYRVRMEMKEHSLARLFCSRLNLRAAVDMQLIRWDCHDTGVQRELFQLFSYVKWSQWFTDYV